MIRERLIAGGSERLLGLIQEFIEYRVQDMKLRKFATASDEDRGIVQGMMKVSGEIASITAEINNRQRSDHAGT